MLPPPAPVVSNVSSQLQMALLQVLQGLGSSGGVAPIPDVSVIDRSVKNAKAKGNIAAFRKFFYNFSLVQAQHQTPGYRLPYRPASGKCR